MYYAITFITNQQLRDIKLEGILNPDFTMDKYIHEGKFDYSARIRNGRSMEIYSSKVFGDKSILNCTKWKTIRGAENAFRGVKAAISEKKRISVRGNEDWSKNEYIPVICNITESWNEKITNLIDREERDHKKRIESLTKKLVKA